MTTHEAKVAGIAVLSILLILIVVRFGESVDSVLQVERYKICIESQVKTTIDLKCNEVAK
jgi:hypothetical protein